MTAVGGILRVVRRGGWITPPTTRRGRTRTARSAVSRSVITAIVASSSCSSSRRRPVGRVYQERQGIIIIATAASIVVVQIVHVLVYRVVYTPLLGMGVAVSLHNEHTRPSQLHNFTTESQNCQL
jgi:hypothetical protein